MYLNKLTLHNFKNYTSEEINFSNKINCFIGNNGEGKTNLLDAIHYLSFCKSFFNSIDYLNIRHDEDFFALHGFFTINGGTQDNISCIQKKNQKKIFKINQKEYERLADHIGLYPLVMISPYDRDLINEGSEIRRKLIDSVISQFNRTYLEELIHYNRILFQRNVLLKEFGERNIFDYSALEIWDTQLIHFGNLIHEKRNVFLREFIPLFSYYYKLMSNSKESIDIVYESQLNYNSFNELLSNALEKDKNFRFSTVGIHKDDLLFNINGYPVKKFGSQGQQKTFVVAIKLAQFEYTKNKKGFKPLLLFDDIFDKLDDSRVEKIVKLVSEDNFGQVFITDTQLKRIENIFSQHEIEHKIFFIENGKVLQK